MVGDITSDINEISAATPTGVITGVDKEKGVVLVSFECGGAQFAFALFPDCARRVGEDIAEAVGRLAAKGKAGE